MNENPTETEAGDDPGVAILAEYTHSPAELLARLDHARATTGERGREVDERTLDALRVTRDMLASYDIGGDREVTLSTNVLGMAVADLDGALDRLHALAASASAGVRLGGAG